jgi:hypothetical protein
MPPVIGVPLSPVPATLGILFEILRVLAPPFPATRPVPRKLAVFTGAIPLVPGVVDIRLERFPAMQTTWELHGASSSGRTVKRIRRKGENGCGRWTQRNKLKEVRGKASNRHGTNSAKSTMGIRPATAISRKSDLFSTGLIRKPLTGRKWSATGNTSRNCFPPLLEEKHILIMVPKCYRKR